MLLTSYAGPVRASPAAHPGFYHQVNQHAIANSNDAILQQVLCILRYTILVFSYAWPPLMSDPDGVYGTSSTVVEGALTSATSASTIYPISRHASTGLDEATSKTCERYRYPQSLLYFLTTSKPHHICTCKFRETYLQEGIEVFDSKSGSRNWRFSFSAYDTLVRGGSRFWLVGLLTRVNFKEGHSIQDPSRTQKKLIILVFLLK